MANEYYDEGGGGDLPGADFSMGGPRGGRVKERQQAYFPVFAFTNATNLSILTQNLRLEYVFQGERLIANVARTGTSATGIFPQLVQLTVGTRPMVQGGPLPQDNMRVDTIGIYHPLPKTRLQQLYQAQSQLTSQLASGDLINVFQGIYGRAWL